MHRKLPTIAPHYFDRQQFARPVETLRGFEMDAMLFNVAQLMKSPVGSSFVTDFQESGEITLDNDLKVAGPISGHTRMRRTNQGLLVDGWVDLTLELSCTRCLKDFQQPMHVTFEEQFYPTVDVVTGMPLPAFDEEEIFPIDDHHQVDLTEAVRQNVLTALPMVTICQEDCKGQIHLVVVVDRKDLFLIKGW